MCAIQSAIYLCVLSLIWSCNRDTTGNGLYQYEGEGSNICGAIQADTQRSFDSQAFTDKTGAESYHANLVEKERSSVVASIESCNLKKQNLRAADEAPLESPTPAGTAGKPEKIGTANAAKTGKSLSLNLLDESQGIGCAGDTVEEVEATLRTYQTAKQKLSSCRIQFSGSLAQLNSVPAVAESPTQTAETQEAIAALSASECDPFTAKELQAGSVLATQVGKPAKGLSLDRIVGSEERNYRTRTTTARLNTGVANGGISYSVEETITYSADYVVDESALGEGVDPRDIRCLAQVDPRTQAQYQYGGFAKCSVTASYTVGNEAFGQISAGIGIASAQVAGTFGQETTFRAALNNFDSFRTNATFRINVNEPEDRVEAICRSWIAGSLASLQADLQTKVQSKLAGVMNANSCTEDSQCQDTFSGARWIGRCISNGTIAACQKRGTGIETQGDYWWGTSCGGYMDVPCDATGGFYCKSVTMKTGTNFLGYDFTTTKQICVNSRWENGPFSQRILNQ